MYITNGGTSKATQRLNHSKRLENIQLINFGVIASKNTVASGHSSVSGNHTVISSGNRDTGPAQKTHNIQTLQQLEFGTGIHFAYEKISTQGLQYPPLLSQGDQFACCFGIVTSNQLSRTINRRKREGRASEIMLRVEIALFSSCLSSQESNSMTPYDVVAINYLGLLL